MLLRLRRIVNILIYILIAPLVGHEEACRYIMSYGDKEDRYFYTALLRSKVRNYLSPKSIEEQLISISRNYEISNIDSSTYFEYLFNKVLEYFEYLKKRISDLYIAVLTGSIGLFLFSLTIVLLIPQPVLKVVSIAMPLLFIPLVHLNQLDIYEYRYRIPILVSSLSAILVLIICLVLHVDTLFTILLTLLIFCITFSLLYIPQFLKFINLILNVNSRILTPMYRLMWNPISATMIRESKFEREIWRLIELGQRIGAPWFISRIARLVDSLVSMVMHIYKTGIIYSIFIPAGYLVTSYVINMIYNTPISALPYSYYTPSILLSVFTLLRCRIMFLIYMFVGSVVASLLTGKAMHSLGLGVCIIPILVLVCLFQIKVI